MLDSRFFATATALGLALAGSAAAVPLAPTSYDMHNGHGKASSGSYNYWDKSYDGSGSTTTDNAFLHGGTGDLTDGVVSHQNWFAVESASGTGPYVGWRKSVLAEPKVRFHFAGPVDIDTIRIHADDDGASGGGVSLPASVRFDWAGGSQTFAVVDPNPGSSGPSWLEFAGLGISGVSHVAVSFGYRDHWVFIDEVSFASTSAPVPEPATYGLMLAGLAALAWRRRRG